MKKTKEILEQWIQAINNSDINKLLALYDETAILIPTFSNKLLNSPKKIRDYFEKLNSREELSVMLHENTLEVQALHDDIFILNGIYNWRFKVDGELLNFEGRFSYVVDQSKSSPIIHHHSSQIPRML